MVRSRRAVVTLALVFICSVPQSGCSTSQGRRLFAVSAAVITIELTDDDPIGPAVPIAMLTGWLGIYLMMYGDRWANGAIPRTEMLAAVPSGPEIRMFPNGISLVYRF